MRVLLAAATLAVLWALLFPAGAMAQSPTGGSFSAPPPVISDLVCRSSCLGVRNTRPGAVVRVRGRDLATVTEVLFTGARGTRDDVAVKPVKARGTWLDARVPRRAVGGPLALVNLDGARSKPSRLRLGVDASGAALKQKGAVSDAPGLELVVAADRVFYGGARPATLTYVVRDSAAVDVTVELLRADDGAVVASWPSVKVPPETPRTVTWNGTAGGAVQPDGRYTFRVTARNGKGAVASSSQAAQPGAAAPGSFTFLRHKFPVRGAHGYGEFAASFGGGRGHQGHDVFARCGTPLVAARSGVVKLKDTHSRAGNYLVIDGDATGVDYVYMHLREPAVVEQGDRVRTGQRIGSVGDTGRASGCHLHFELWSAPGWYTGGSPFDPLPELRAWDAQS